VLAPQWWGRRGAANRLGARLKLRPTQKQAPAGGIGGMSFERIVAVDWELALGDETLTLKELERLARLKMPLVQIRGQWAVLDPQQIEAAIKFWEVQQKTPTELSLPDALRLLLAQEEQVGGVDVAGVSADDWLADLVEGLRTSAGQMTLLPQPPAFVGQLRPYQQRAFRIGQTRNVQAHKFVCAGTLEEAIDDLIERKKALAEAVVGTGEGWLTELSTDDLRQLLTLRKNAIG
jgi:hypothetical protein